MKAPRVVPQPRLDEETRGAARDTSAFGPLYKEHFEGLYDFVARIVRDQDLAGEVVQSTFTKAWYELRSGHELRQPKAWLYAVARNRALDELRRQQRLADEPLLYTQPDFSRLSDPQAVAEDNEMVELVWSSAAALSAEEYSLLDLHVRHGLGAAELADALDLHRGAVYTRLSRLRDSLEDAVKSTLLVRRGREECQELAAIVAEHESGEELTPELRRAVSSHVADCEICCEARRRLASPIMIFGALTPIVALPGLRDGIWQALAPGGAAAGASAAGGKGALAARQGAKARYWAAGAAGVAAAGAALFLALSHAPRGHDPSRVASLDHALGVPSSDPTVSMTWSPGKNAKGYSVVFSRDKSFEPPARENVTGTHFTSTPLSPGRWWFILRTHGKDGGWTHTVRIGPFVITAPAAEPPVVAKAPPKRHRNAHRPATAPRHHRAAAPAAQRVAAAHAQKPSRPTVPPRQEAKRKQPPRKKTKKSPPRAVSPPAESPPAATAPPVEQPVSPTATPEPPACDDDEGCEDEGEGGDHHGDDDHGDHDHDHGDEHGGHGDH